MKRLPDLIIGKSRWQGRLSRKGFWLTFLGLQLVGLLLFPLQLAAVAFPPATPTGIVLNTLLFLACVPFLWLLLGALVRRLHDRGRAGWWLLMFFGPFVLLGTAQNYLLEPGPQQGMQEVLLIVGLALVMPTYGWGLFEILLLKGQSGTNRFGPDPLEPVAEAPSELEIKKGGMV